MDVNKILSADILDIIFEGRNKEYGAYDLRKTYNKRLATALIATAALCLLLFVGYILSNTLANQKKEVVVQDVQLEDMKTEEKKNEPPPPPPPKPPEPPKVEMAKFTPPKIVKDEEVKEDEKPPEIEKLEDTKIGTVNQEGIKDEGIVAPPVDDGKGVVEAPKKDEEDYDKTFTKVEIESDYPGGTSAWARYLNKSLRYPQEAIDNEIQGTVVVQFIVDKEGNVSDVEAVSGPNELRDEAVRVIKKSGKWTPAIQNGRQVKSYKKQPIVFRLETEG
ncbi:MAG: TonB family protein [Chitinophagaceae bacterium]|jgi:periplasmic protein TonB|uniref:energy transducer TonB n=1 Tax=unclassified Paraflavitalea TaxID=2798305 RepID=UPI003D329451|nr:TonB family protein [Chitinophagaceae bacterium]